MVRRPQRRLLPRRPQQALPARQQRLGLRLQRRQRRTPNRPTRLTAAMDPPNARRPQTLPSPRPRHLRRTRRVQPISLRIPATTPRRNRPLRPQPVPPPPTRPAQPLRPLPRPRPRRTDRRNSLPQRQRPPIPAHPVRVRLLLVQRRAGPAGGPRPARGALLVGRATWG